MWFQARQYNEQNIYKWTDLLTSGGHVELKMAIKETNSRHFFFYKTFIYKHSEENV